MADNRTERATPRKRQKAREKGQVLRSRDLISALTVLAVVFMLAWDPELWIGRWRTYFSHLMQAGTLTEWTNSMAVIQWTGLTVARWVIPILAVAFTVAISSTLAQGGLVIASE